MLNRCLIVLTAVLSTSCALPPYTTPSPEALGPNPATLRVTKINTDNMTSSALSILSHEINCKQPGTTQARITNLGFVENPRFKAKSKEPPYSVQIPGRQQIIIYLGFIKEYVGKPRICEMLFSFEPEAGAVYQLDRRFNTSYGTLGGCSFDIAKVVVTEQGETMEKLKNYRWSILDGFKNATYLCDENGNYTEVPRKRMRTSLEKISDAPDGPLWKETYIPF